MAIIGIPSAKETGIAGRLIIELTSGFKLAKTRRTVTCSRLITEMVFYSFPLLKLIQYAEKHSVFSFTVSVTVALSHSQQAEANSYMVSEPIMDESFNTSQTTPPNPPPNTIPAQPNTNSSGAVSHDPTQPTSPYYIGSSYGSGAMLVTHIFDSSNYYSWARSMKRALRIKNKLEFIDGTIYEPFDPNDPLMEHWLRCNDIVITWMRNTMAVDIKSNTTYAETTYQFWLELEQRFAQKNAPRIFEVVVQNQQRDCVMKFLMGLNDTYKAIKAQILLIKPFPSLNEVYSIIQQEEKR
ncbi:uncharacterized protein LOC131158772 [Malania oleifera]|uniref:uncharacterized protein LOC131158772 n=1 Tax=Malania oleifera TaxID=397392 RepID=UPI0025ADAAA9|nr:uncharacterized protein LOC131158772 [Malania oleifera]